MLSLPTGYSWGENEHLYGLLPSHVPLKTTNYSRLFGFTRVEVLLYVHTNRRFIRDGSPGRPPRLSHSSWALIHARHIIIYTYVKEEKGKSRKGRGHWVTDFGYSRNILWLNFELEIDKIAVTRCPVSSCVGVTQVALLVKKNGLSRSKNWH